MAEELQRIEVSPGRFKKMTRAQAEAYRRRTKEREPLNKTVSTTGTQVEREADVVSTGAQAEGEPKDAPLTTSSGKPRSTRRTTKRSAK